ncbi:MAG: hypothetical protein RR241_02920 [Raoultibacter sp.]
MAQAESLIATKKQKQSVVGGKLSQDGGHKHGQNFFDCVGCGFCLGLELK